MTDLTKETVVAVRMFSGRIAQILDNILQNALSFSPAEGMITVQAACDEHVVTITIDDDGPGDS